MQKTTAQTVSRHCLIKFIASEDSQQIMGSHSTDGCKAPYLHGVETLGNFCHHLMQLQKLYEADRDQRELPFYYPFHETKWKKIYQQP